MDSTHKGFIFFPIKPVLLLEGQQENATIKSFYCDILAQLDENKKKKFLNLMEMTKIPAYKTQMAYQSFHDMKEL